MSGAERHFPIKLPPGSGAAALLRGPRWLVDLAVGFLEPRANRICRIASTDRSIQAHEFWDARPVKMKPGPWGLSLVHGKKFVVNNAAKLLIMMAIKLLGRPAKVTTTSHLTGGGPPLPRISPASRVGGIRCGNRIDPCLAHLQQALAPHHNRRNPCTGRRAIAGRRRRLRLRNALPAAHPQCAHGHRRRLPVARSMCFSCLAATYI